MYIPRLGRSPSEIDESWIVKCYNTLCLLALSDHYAIDTPGTQRTGCGVPLTDVSPESSYVNGFSSDLSLFDTLQIQYIIHWSIDKKLLRHEI